MIPSNAPVLAPLILLLAGITIPILGFKWKGLAYPVAQTAAVAAAAVSISNIFRVLKTGPLHYQFGAWIPPIGIEYVLDPLSAFVTAAVTGIAAVVLIHARATVARELPQHRVVPYYALVMLFLSGSSGIIMTGDLFNLYVFLEISSLSLYGLIAVGEKKAPVAAFRYLIMGTVGGGFYLLGVGFLYFVTGSLNMADVRDILAAVGVQPPVIVAACLMVIGLGIKMALFPLHGWLPDAYTQAPSATSAIMAPIGTKIGAYGILRILFFVFGVRFVTLVFPLNQVIAWLSIGGILYGSIMALAQKEFKRLLAYSSVAQIGYIGLGIGLANPLGLIGAVLHVLNHGMMKALLFLVAANFRSRLGHSDITRLDHSVRRILPWTTAGFTVGALSMIGIPPTVGFFSKWYLALGAIEGQQWFFLGVILLSSLLNAVYFFRVIEKIYLKPVMQDIEERADDASVQREEVALSMLAPTLLFAAALIVFGLLNAWIVKGVLMKMLPPGL